MAFLELLEGLRTPFFDAIFSVLTRLGEETLFMVGGMIFFWCVDKRKGYFLLYVGFLGTVINQFLKMLCCVPRPWLRDPSFTIVERAREGATGYSFPSGHTQTAVGLYGGIARFSKKAWAIVPCILALLLTAFSRMYLGVHTPADVLVSFGVAAVLVLALWLLFRRSYDHERILPILFAALLLVTAAFVCYAEIAPFPADAVEEYSLHGVKNAYTMLGVAIGLNAVYWMDRKWVRFSTKAPWWGQILKCALGFGIVIAVRVFLKMPLYALTGGHYAADAIRYFLMVLVGGGLWPLTFRVFDRRRDRP